MKTLKVAAKNPNGIAKRGRPPKNRFVKREEPAEVEDSESDDEKLEADEKVDEMQIDFTNDLKEIQNEDTQT